MAFFSSKRFSIINQGEPILQPKQQYSQPQTQKQEDRDRRRHIRILSQGCNNPDKITAKSPVKKEWSNKECVLWLYHNAYYNYGNTPSDAFDIASAWKGDGRWLEALARSDLWDTLNSQETHVIVNIYESFIDERRQFDRSMRSYLGIALSYQ